MPRYFIEVYYKGTNYSGFQIQQNANSIQSEIEKALKIFFRVEFALTGASRTDAGVHALSNYFHFDSNAFARFDEDGLRKSVYNLNAILPGDIVVRRIYRVPDNAHCRFDAKGREYKYYIYQRKDPFHADRAYYYPYKLDFEVLQRVAGLLLSYHDFTSFSKRNTQVHTHDCTIVRSEWQWEGNLLVYNVLANRFLRGMVRGLVGTMLKAGTGKLTVEGFSSVIESKDCALADFSVPPHGLFLAKVQY